MGNLVTKLTTNNMQLNESNVSEVVFEQVRWNYGNKQFPQFNFVSFLCFLRNAKAGKQIAAGSATLENRTFQEPHELRSTKPIDFHSENSDRDV